MSRGPSILLLGDSHTFGYYGKELENLFVNAGWKVTRVGWVGASAGSYLTGRWSKLGMGGVGNFDAAVRVPYDLAVITLGTNDAAGLRAGAPGTPVANALEELAGQLNAKVVWWVGPPAFSDNAARTYNQAFRTDDLNARSARVWDAASARFGARAVDPRIVTAGFVKETDIHFGPRGGAAWAQYVFDRVTAEVPVVGNDGPRTPPVTGGGKPQIGGILVTVAALALLGIVWWRRRAPVPQG